MASSGADENELSVARPGQVYQILHSVTVAAKAVNLHREEAKELLKGVKEIARLSTFYLESCRSNVDLAITVVRQDADTVTRASTTGPADGNELPVALPEQVYQTLQSVKVAAKEVDAIREEAQIFLKDVKDAARLSAFYFESVRSNTRLAVDLAATVEGQHADTVTLASTSGPSAGSAAIAASLPVLVGDPDVLASLPFTPAEIRNRSRSRSPIRSPDGQSQSQPHQPRCVIYPHDGGG